MSKNTNRKIRAAAVALSIVGVAGLSMAAAAQLNLSFTGSFQAGATTVTADCQTGDVGVAFSVPAFDTAATTGAPWKISTVTFSGISAPCSGKSFKTAYKTTGGWVEIAGTGAGAGTGTISGTSVSVNIPSGINQQDITQLALTIHSA